MPSETFASGTHERFRFLFAALLLVGCTGSTSVPGPAGPLAGGPASVENVSPVEHATPVGKTAPVGQADPVEGGGDAKPESGPVGTVTPPPEDAEERVVARVFDGDSVLLKRAEDRPGGQYRYIGLDTPEREQPLYEVASERNRALVEGKTVRVAYDVGQKDRYRRRLAYLWVETAEGWVFVNELLAREGLGRAYPHRKSERYTEAIFRAQEAARAEGRGVWSLPPPSPESYYYATSGRRFHRPGCPGIQRANKDKFQRFETRDEAFAAGNSPCRTCEP